jgi:hypothetical protein
MSDEEQQMRVRNVAVMPKQLTMKIYRQTPQASGKEAGRAPVQVSIERGIKPSHTKCSQQGEREELSSSSTSYASSIIRKVKQPDWKAWKQQCRVLLICRITAGSLKIATAAQMPRLIIVDYWQDEMHAMLCHFLECMRAP